MKPSVAAPPLPHIPTGFLHLDLLLKGGYPTGAISTLAGNPHAAQTLLTYAYASAAGRSLRAGCLRAFDYRGALPRTVALWSDATFLLTNQVDVLLIEAVNGAQVRALPAALPAILRSHRKTLLMSISSRVPHTAAVKLMLRPVGWLYRQSDVASYRLRVALESVGLPRRSATLLVPVPPDVPGLPPPLRIDRNGSG